MITKSELDAAIEAAGDWYEKEPTTCPADHFGGYATQYPEMCWDCKVRGLVTAALPAVEMAVRASVAAEHKAMIASVVRELVEMANDPDGPTAEWLSLIQDVAEGKYTPPSEREGDSEQ